MLNFLKSLFQKSTPAPTPSTKKPSPYKAKTRAPHIKVNSVVELCLKDPRRGLEGSWFNNYEWQHHVRPQNYRQQFVVLKNAQNQLHLKTSSGEVYVMTYAKDTPLHVVK